LPTAKAESITATTIIANKEVPLDFGMPTKIGDPFKADAGTSPTTVSGAVNVVATETQPFPFQYSMTLALVKLGFEILKATETSEPKAPLLEETLTP
jgi:hypothetical protein